MLGGPVTVGQGKIVDLETSVKLRSHLDLQKEAENTKHFKPAVKFYGEIAQRAQKAGIVLDVFCAALDQVGIVEMKACFEVTGGFYIMTDMFANPVFKESFKKFFELDSKGELKMGFLGQLKVLTSKEFKVAGCIGQCTPIKNQPNSAQYVSSTEIGSGGTNCWYLGGIDQNKSMAIYFDIDQTVELKQ